MPLVRSATTGRHHDRRPRATRLGSLLLAGLLTSVVPGSLSAAGPAVATPVPTAPAPGPGIRSTIQYEEAAAHATDRISFKPGARVTVPFQPRTGDPWIVAGQHARSLPAGRVSGAAMLDGSAAALEASAGAAPLALHRVDPVFRPDAAVDPGALKREVFGFLPYWELTDTDTTLDWETLSTVAYFGVGADGAGNLVKRNSDGTASVGWRGWTSAAMTNLIDTAHTNHARVVLTVQSFAWTSTGLKRQRALLGSPTARARLASQIATAVHDRGADGVNLDFEPIASGSASQFTALVRKVRAALDAKAPGYQLTFDTTGWIGNYPVAAATARGGADAVFVMGYDYRAASSNTVGSIAPVGGPTYDVRDTILAYLDDVPASKLILGVPYYGRAWSTSSAGLGARNVSGTKNGASTSVTYVTARQYATDHGKHYDATEGVAWTAYRRKNCTATYGCVTPWRQLYFDDATALKAKYDLVNAYGLRGVGIWALGYDGTRPELHQALKAKFITDTVPPVIGAGSLSATTFSPNGDGVLDAVSARLRVTGLVTWGYTVRHGTSSAPGSVVRSGSQAGKDPALTWDGRDTAGRQVKDGRYLITLWTADVSGNRASRSFGVSVDTRPSVVRSSASLGFLSPDGDHHNDTLPLAWTADETVSGTISVRTATGATVRHWSVRAAAAWTTTWSATDQAGRVLPDGRYTFRVDGRDGAGNRTLVDRTVLVDRTIRSVGWSRASFAPKAKETTRVVIDLRRKARLTVAIYHGDQLIRTVWTGRTVAAGRIGWTWDGRNAAKAVVPAGAYRIVVTATSAIGTTRYSKAVTVRAH